MSTPFGSWTRHAGRARSPGMEQDKVSRRMSRRAVVLGGFGALTLAPAARADWLSKGKEALESVTGADGGASGLSGTEVTKGLKEALRVASGRVVDQVGQAGGYLQDSAIHIPLPGYLAQAQGVLQTVGAAGLLTDLETQLNRAAEAAAPEAERIFADSIAAMTLKDAKRILNGPDDAATQYFRRTMSPELRKTFRPVVDRHLAETGAMRTLDRTLQSYQQVPFAKRMKGNAQDRLVDHGLDGALSGIFHYMAKEEAAIRQNPAKRTTDLLKRVFG